MRSSWIALLLLTTCTPAYGQAGRTAVGAPQASRKSVEPKTSEAAAELQRRLANLQAAKSSGDPARVAHASELVIALALRELGQVRLVESAYGQAAELYGRSLNFENIPETRVDLALAELQAGDVDKAIQDADQALLENLNNVRALQVLGHAWTVKKNYPEAVRALTRAAEIEPNLENLYALAIAQLAIKEPDQAKGAARTFGEIEKLTGDSGSLHVIFGRAYRDAGDLPAAIREFETAIKLDTRTPHAHYFLGLAHLAANEWAPTPEVKAEFQRELQFYPRDYLANYMLGFVYSAARNYDEAEKYLKTATTINPMVPDPWLYLGLGAYSKNNMSEAERCFRKAIELTGEDDAHANYQIRRAYIDLSRILVNSGRKEEAEPYVKKAHELQNKILQTSQQGMASHYMEEGVEGAAAAAVVTPPLTEEPTGMKNKATNDPFAQVDPEVMARANLTKEQMREGEAQERQLRLVLAQSYSDLGTSDAIRKDYGAALTHYQESERWDASLPGLKRNLGVAAFRHQDYSEAMRALPVALAANPRDEAVRAMLALSYFGVDKYAEAVKTFAPLGEKSMKDAAVGYAWAASLTRTGANLEAAKVLTAYESVDRPSETLLLVGQLWIEIGDYRSAVATLHRALQINPSLPKAHYFAGQALIRSEHWEEAEQEFRAELALVPGDPDAKFNLGFVLLQLSRVGDAEILFKEVIAAHPDYPNAQYEYGKILMDQGDVEGAIAHMEIAARMSPEMDYVHYQLQAAYRKAGRTADADRELEIYKKIKAKHRERASAAIPLKTP